MTGLTRLRLHRKLIAARWLEYLALFLVVVGARLWLVSLYGSPVPIMDQWDGEGASLFKPWIEGTLRISDLFQPHNEHRILLSRLLALGLLGLNGQWDAQLEMAVNALLCGAMAVLIAVALVKLFGHNLRTLILLVVGLWSALPYGHENTLWAFESSFYFLLFFSLLAIWGLALYPLFSWPWWAGVAGLVLACLSMASGFFATLVLLGLSAVRLIKRRTLSRDSMILIALCCAVAAVAVYYRTTVPAHAAIRASSLRVWVNFFGCCLAWPFCTTSAACLIMYLPAGLLVARYLSKHPTALCDTWEGQAEALIGVSAWVILQAAAMAYLRGGGTIPPPVSRYMDILALGALANLLAILLLVKELPNGTAARQVGIVFATCWITALGAGAVFISQSELASRGARTQSLYAIEENVRAYVATGDRKHLEGNPPPTIPYPRASRLAMLLDDPTIRSILPAVVRAPLRVGKASDTGNAFVPDGYAPPVHNWSYEQGWGSYSAQGVAARGSMQSQSITTRLHYLQFEITGYMRKGLSLVLQSEKTGKKARVIPTNREDKNWRLAYVAVPGENIRILAEDDNAEEWFGFREPRELARFSYYADIFTRRGKSICFSGAILWLGLLLLRFPQAWSK
jgi:uncharacterized membrane protein